MALSRYTTISVFKDLRRHFPMFGIEIGTIAFRILSESFRKIADVDFWCNVKVFRGFDPSVVDLKSRI